METNLPMRYLIIILLCLSVSVYGQVGVELSAGAGLLRTTIAEQYVSSYRVSNKQAYSIGVDLLQNKFRKPFTLSFGTRIGLHLLDSDETYERNIQYPPFKDTQSYHYRYGFIHLALPIAANYKIRLSDNAGLRLSAGAGPMFREDMGGGREGGGSFFSVYTEAAAGFILLNRLTVGVKLTAPFVKHGLPTYGLPVNVYQLQTLQADIRWLIPNLSDMQPQNVAKLKRNMEKSAAKRRENKAIREEEKRKRNLPYLDLVLNGGIMFPNVTNEYTRKGITDISTATMINIGLDVMFNSKQRHVFISVGPRLGYSMFDATTSENTQVGNYYDARSVNTGLTAGLNYSSDPKGRFSITAAGLIQIGLKAPFNGPMLEGYYMPEIKAGVRINHNIGINLGGFYLPVEAWKGSPLHTRNPSIKFNVYGIMAELRFSFGKYK